MNFSLIVFLTHLQQLNDKIKEQILFILNTFYVESLKTWLAQLQVQYILLNIISQKLQFIKYINMLKADGVEDWPMIPTKAFLYFPTGPEVIEGKDEKQWRKIFQDGNNYTAYQNSQLQILEKKLKQLRIVPHAWFDKANKLRFLQANKFKIEDTCKSIKEGSTWRESSFPLKKNPQAETKLNEGTMYFCGRDRQYRPILVCQITKMKKYSKEIVPVILNTLLEYALEHLLIPGQVENYVLIINLDDAGLSDRESVSKIVSFTSNTYRSRLFASYLLNTPFLIASGWNAFASAIVSENTLRKIKISRQATHEDLFKHTDKDIVQKKYGGNLANLEGPFWPPSQKLMNYVSSVAHPSGKDHHISKEEYNKKYKDGQLKDRKVKKQLLNKQALATPKKAKQEQDHEFLQNQKLRASINNFSSPTTSNKRLVVSQNLNSTEILSRDLVLEEVLPPIQKRTFKLFFEEESFIQAIKKIK